MRCCDRCRCKSSSRIPASSLCCIVVRVSRIPPNFASLHQHCDCNERNDPRSLVNISLLLLSLLSPPVRLGQYRHHDRLFAVRANAFFRSDTVNSQSIVRCRNRFLPDLCGTGTHPIVIPVVVYFCVKYSTSTVRESRDIRPSRIIKCSIVLFVKL